MKTLWSAAAFFLVATGSTANAQSRHEYWFTSELSDNKMVEYIDAASVAPGKDLKRAWIVTIYASNAPQLAGLHVTGLTEVNCRTGQRHSLQTTANDSSGAVVPSASEYRPEAWTYAVPDSVGETELKFICAKSLAERTQIGIKLAPSVTPETSAEMMFSQDNTSNSATSSNSTARGQQ